MPRTALVLLVVYLALAFGLRSWMQWRRTGSSGFRGISGVPGSAEWWGGVLFVVAMVAVLIAPLAQLLDRLPPLPAWHAGTTRFVGLLLAVLGAAATLWSQLAMGESWRIGVDEAEHTPLIEHGPFRWVRNPIFTSMAAVFLGIALMVPNALAAIALTALLGALQLQVRRVEEPYLLRVHGPRYRSYAARAGRFLPGLGRLRERPRAAIAPPRSAAPGRPAGGTPPYRDSR